MTSNRFPHDSMRNDEDALEAEWKRQERILRSLREDASSSIEAETADAGERALFAALAREPVPPPPVDFVPRAVAAAERLAMARRQVARFRRMLGVLLGIGYLPAMALVALMYLPKLRASQPAASDESSLGSWLIAIAALGLLSLAIDLLKRRIVGDDDVA